MCRVVVVDNDVVLPRVCSAASSFGPEKLSTRNCCGFRGTVHILAPIPNRTLSGR